MKARIERPDDREAAVRRLEMLASATPALMAASLDPQAVLEQLTGILVPGLGGWVAVDVLGEGGDLRRAAGRGEDAPSGAGPAPGDEVTDVVRSGRTRTFVLARAHLKARGKDRGTRDALVGREALVVPLAARGRVLGAVTLVAGVDKLRYGPEDISLVEDLVHRAALTYDNASLHASVSVAERRFRDLVQGLDAIVWEVDPASLAITFVSEPVERILGYEPGRWLVERDLWREVLFPAERDDTVRALAEAIRAGGDQRLDLRVRAADGRPVWLRVLLRTERDAAGRRTGVRGIAVDVTENATRARRQAAEHAVVLALAEARTLAEVTPQVLRAIGEGLDWVVGALWALDEEANVLRCVDLWSAADFPEFEALTRRTGFPKGVGLPGRVWESGEPAWIEDVTRDQNFPRIRVAMAEGIHGAFAFPVAVAGRFLGVIEFFCTEVRSADTELLRMMRSVGAQIGSFIARARAEGERSFQRALLESQSEATIDGILVVGPDGRVISTNRRFREMWGIPDDVAATATRQTLLPLLTEQVADEEAFLARVRYLIDNPDATGRDEIVLRDGRIFDRWTTPLANEAGGHYGRALFFRDVTEQMAAQREIEESRERATFLAEAATLLASSLDRTSTLERLARLAVPRLADWCVIDLAEDDGGARRLTVAHIDPEKVKIAQELQERYPPDPDAPRGALHVIRTGQPELYREISDEILVAAARDDEHLAILRSLGFTSAMVVPLSARGRTLGAITLVASESGRRFDEDDLAFALDLGGRAALAMDNARLYRERSDVAQTLQQSLLPPLLPDIPGVALAARFRPAGEGAEVGGDFYDVFATGREDWAIVIGDVCGKGAEAAALTALSRYTLRAAAMQARKPSRILGILNEAMLLQRSDRRFCTVLYARLRRDGGRVRLTVACGGHPQPIVVRADGSVVTAGKAGTLLGFFPDPELNDESLDLGPGDALVLYTDGVIEARAGAEVFGEDRLRDLLAGCAGLSAEEMAERIESAVLDFQDGNPRDDVAILVVRAEG